MITGMGSISVKQNKVEPQLLAWELKVDKSQRPKQGGNDLASAT